MGRKKGGQTTEGISDGRDPRDGVQINAPAARVIDLWHNADFGQGNGIAKAEFPIPVLLQRAFYPFKAKGDEVLHPAFHRGTMADSMWDHVQIAEGVKINCNPISQSRHQTLWVARKIVRAPLRFGQQIDGN